MINEELRFLRDCVVQSTLNDYENLEMLASEISAWASKENKPYSIELLMSALRGLIEESLDFFLPILVEASS